MKYIICMAACLLANAANASSIGVDYTSDPGDWLTSPSDNWTLGFEFSVSANTQVDGLGFWDHNGAYNTTTVGLWDTSGTLLGTVDTSSPVTSFATGTGHGTWNFMDFNYLLSAGNYVVGSWGQGMEYTFNSAGGGISTNVLTFLDPREKDGGIFQYPSDELSPGYDAFFGANIRFSQIPEPTTLALTGLVLSLIAMRRKR